MGRFMVGGALLGFVLFIATASHGDVNAPPPSLPAGGEPITGTAATPAPGSETVPHDPFTPYDVGPPGTRTWTPDEQPDSTPTTTPNWDQVNAAYASAAQERAHQAASDAAAHELGIVDDLGTIGVVP